MGLLYLIMFIIFILLVALVPYHKSCKEGYINMECKTVKSEGSSMSCDGYGQIADMVTVKKGDEFEKYLRCCKPEDPRVCIHNTCLYEKEFQWVFQAPEQMRRLEEQVRIARQESKTALTTANTAYDNANHAYNRANRAYDRAEEAYKKAYYGSSSDSKEMKDLQDDVKKIKDVIKEMLKQLIKDGTIKL